MDSIRALLLRHRALATLLVAAALAMKVLVPAGFMLGTGERVLSVAICADTQGTQMVRHIVIPGKPASDDPRADHAKAQTACPWSALAMAASGGADAVLLALALAFILALGFVSARAAPLAHFAYVRPPLRGPPARA